jgi:hypothetical protein
MNPRKTIAELEMTGSENIKRSIKRERSEAALPPLAGDQEAEIAQLDSLIQKAMKACRRQTQGKKRNPAFVNLALLINVRKLLLNERGDARQKSTKDLLEEADKLMKGIN